MWAVEGGEWSVYPRRENAVSLPTTKCMGPRASLDAPKGGSPRPATNRTVIPCEIVDMNNNMSERVRYTCVYYLLR